MSDQPEKKTPEAPSPPKKGGLNLFAILLPAALAGGAAFGGAKVAGAHGTAPPVAEHHVAEKPPGPTVALEPFLVTIPDTNKKNHPMKVTLAIEFEASTKEDSLKAFGPRIRDAALSFLRTMTYEDAADPKTDKMRVTLLQVIRDSGASTAERILITDLVVQ